MRRNQAFGTYEQFRSEVLREGAGPIASYVEEMAEELYQTEISEELSDMWDRIED